MADDPYKAAKIAAALLVKRGVYDSYPMALARCKVACRDVALKKLVPYVLAKIPKGYPIA